MLQWGKASPHQLGKEGGQGTQCVPGLGTSRLVGQGTRFGPQMGILAGQGTQGDCSRAPTRLGGMLRHPVLSPNWDPVGLGAALPPAPLC